MNVNSRDLQNYKKIFVFDEYRDKAGVGSQQFFDNLEEAVDYARKQWEHLAKSDKESYMKDPAGFFMVTENEVCMVDGEYYPDSVPLEIFWNAFKYQRTLDLEDAIDEKEKYIKQLEEEIAVELYNDEEEPEGIKDDIKELHDEIKEFQNRIKKL